MSSDPRRSVPRTDVLLAEPRLIEARARVGEQAVRRAVAAAQDGVRRGEVAPQHAVDCALAALPIGPSSLHRVLNATGVVLHTNLGRAPLSPAAVEAVVTAAGYVDVEFDLATGRRARRGAGATRALTDAVPAAQSALIVNNGAAALVLCTTALAAGREIVVSRGELVEIGDGFRLPDLIASTGATLREVGTTNRTLPADYRSAIGERTAAILKVHPSNFRIEGFTSSVDVSTLSEIPVPVVVDIGSGLLQPDPSLPDEPDAQSVLAAGADLVTASGDKLLGGPQAGLILGRADLVERVRRHPLARAMRVDKLTLAALEATLRGPVSLATAYRRADPDELRRRCERVAATVSSTISAEVVTSTGVVGGGGAPGTTLSGWAVALPETAAAALRRGTPPVVGRVERGRCLLDLRCVDPADDEALIAAVLALA